jgi:cytochrome c oxidase cbb3-type subunit 1
MELAWPALNLDLPWTSFGRIRPLHTSAVIFAQGRP